MSVEAMAIALHHSRAKGAAKLILIGIANHDGDGGAWPAMATLATYGNINERNAHYAVEKLVHLGEVSVEINGGGGQSTAEHMRTNLYHFKLKCPPNCDGSKNHRMLCVVCDKELPIARRRSRTHRVCDPLSQATPPVFTDTPDLSRVTDEPSNNQSTPPINTPHLPNRAHAHEDDAYGDDLYAAAIASKNERQRRTTPTGDASGPAGTDPDEQATVEPLTDACPKRLAAPHAYTKGGECIDCGALASERTTETTGALV